MQGESEPVHLPVTPASGSGPNPDPSPGNRPHPGPEPKPKSKAKIGMILSLCAVVVVFFGIYAVGLPDDPEPGDRELLITAQEVNARYGLDIELALGSETLQRRNYLFGSYELYYEYEHPDNAPDLLYVTSTVTHELTKRQADQSYAAMHLSYTTLLDMLGEGVESEEVEGLLDWGERQTAGWLTYEGEVIGAYAVVQDGHDVFDTMIMGVYFDEEELRSLLVDHLVAIEQAGL